MEGREEVDRGTSNQPLTQVITVLSGITMHRDCLFFLGLGELLGRTKRISNPNGLNCLGYVSFNNRCSHLNELVLLKLVINFNNGENSRTSL